MAQDENGIDNTVDDDTQVTAASGLNIAREIRAERENRRRAQREEWKKNPAMAVFKQVVVPSTLIGGTAYMLSHAYGEPKVLESALAGAAYTPLAMVSGPVAQSLGKLSGHLKNMFNGGMFYQQITKEIEYESATRAAILWLLMTSSVLGPTYVNIAASAATSTYNSVVWLGERVIFGIKEFEDSPATQDPAQTPAPAAAPAQETPAAPSV